MKTPDENERSLSSNNEANDLHPAKDMFTVIEEVVHDLLTEVVAINTDQAKDNTTPDNDEAL